MDFNDPVARKNPVPEREMAICKRLLESRKWCRVSRATFASDAGVDSRLLESYESGRSPVRYNVIKKLARHWPINVEWIATGQGSVDNPTIALYLPELDINGNPLFSEVYDEHISKFAEEFHSYYDTIGEIAVSIKDATPATRIRCLQRLVWHLREWMIKVPDSHLKHLVWGLSKFENRLKSQIPQDSETNIQQRRLHMERPTAPLRAWPPGIENSIKNCQEELTIEPTTPSLPVMSDKTVSLWDYLRERLAPHLRPYGAQSALAIHLKVTRQAVSEWMLGNSSPNAETTLRLLQWVEHQEAQQKSSGSVSARPEHKTRKENSDENSKSNPKRK